MIATFQVDVTEPLLRRFQKDLLARIAADDADGVVFDLSGVAVIDSHDFEHLRRTAAMAAVMGTRPVLCGLRPGVVSALVDLDIDVCGVETCRDLDDALEQLRTPLKAER